MGLALQVSVTPDRLPAEPCDVALAFVMRNAGGTPIKVAPDAAKLAAVASFSGVGFTWNLELVGPAPVRVVELRTYYGPPGNPPAPGYVTKAEVTIAPGAEHVAGFAACWIPSTHLTPEQIAVATLDPMGMDNLVVAPRSSVLVIGATWKQLSATRGKPDFLRGHVVAFFAEPGAYELRVRYLQMPWMKVGEQHDAAAAPVTLHVP